MIAHVDTDDPSSKPGERDVSPTKHREAVLAAGLNPRLLPVAAPGPRLTLPRFFRALATPSVVIAPSRALGAVTSTGGLPGSRYPAAF